MPRSPTIDKFKRATAKRLRLNATDAEQHLWQHLKRLETRGTHFRRQMPIGNYIVDFACPAARLIIELDGSHHGDEQVIVRDEKRTRWLEAEGYRVLRFWNNDIAHNMTNVMEMIYAALYGSLNADAPFSNMRAGVPTAPSSPPRRAARADPPPPGEGEDDSR